MAHVRKQLRDAVIARLGTVAAIAGAYPQSRASRAFQNDEFPVALVAVSETASRDGKNPEGQRAIRRSLVVTVRLGIRDDDENAEDVLDACAVETEKALAVSADLGVGSLAGWVYAGTTVIQPYAVSDGMLLAVQLSYTCDVLTLDVAPETNLFA